MIGASGEGATPGVSTAGPPGPSHPPQSKLPQATTTSGICPFNNLARWRRRERRYSGGCCARDIVGGRGHPSADQTVLFPPMVSGSPPLVLDGGRYLARWLLWTASRSLAWRCGGRWALRRPLSSCGTAVRLPVVPRRTLWFLARVGGDRGQRELLRLTRPHARHRLGVTVCCCLGRTRGWNGEASIVSSAQQVEVHHGLVRRCRWE